VSELPAESSWLVLDEASKKLLISVRSAILIGVIEQSSGRVQLAEGSPVTDVTAKRFSGHQDMVRHRAISVAGTLGFSLEIASGEVRAFYRTSILNREFEDFAVPSDMMSEVLAVLGLPRAADFRSYP
jgi:hypothetical protein